MARLLIDDEAWCETDFRPLLGTKKEHPGGIHKHESWEWIFCAPGAGFGLLPLHSQDLEKSWFRCDHIPVIAVVP
jgi:hypothetical protein